MFRRSRIILALFWFGHFAASGTVPVAAEQIVETDLLIVGGSESAVAAALQAARLGIPRIELVNDIDWLGGQFTAEGLGAVDEWTLYKKSRAIFPRSGIFLELMTLIEDRMEARYGLRRPGNSFCAWTTCEPRETETLIRNLLAPHLRSAGGPLSIHEFYEPQKVFLENGTVQAVQFACVKPGVEPLTIRARMTIDASDWGDVIRLCGAGYLSGPDLRSDFQEPGAPENFEQVDRFEMNPLTYCLVLREAAKPALVKKPPHYDERQFFGTTVATRREYLALKWPAGTLAPFAPAWRDSTMAAGPYNEPPTVYTHRRLIDRRHNQLAPGTELVLLNWPLQDYPTYNFPQRVVDALEAREPGSSRKSLVDLSPELRRIVFQDAKDHALGMLHHLQTTVAERDAGQPVTFRDLELTDEFGTPDRLPPKPYLREALRLRALYMVREQDVRDRDGTQSWAESMPPDAVFGYQFNIDFHPTRRIFLNDDRTGPWAHHHSQWRNWSTDTDRSSFPLRSLIPEKVNGLLPGGKSLGYTSIVSSAVRLHQHGMQVGQAVACIAALCLRENIQPREVALRGKYVRQVQSFLVEPPEDPRKARRPLGVLLWPYQDLPPSASAFAAVNHLAIRGIWPGDSGSQDFFPERVVTRREVARILVRAGLSTNQWKSAFPRDDKSPKTFMDLDRNDPDFRSVELLVKFGTLSPTEKFLPDEPALDSWALGLLAHLGWVPQIEPPPVARPLTRAVFAQILWDAIKTRPERTWGETDDLPFAPGRDSDRDGRPDLDDPLPFDRDNDSVPDVLDLDD